MSRRFAELKGEMERRNREMGQVYRPSVYQDPIHRCKSSEIIVRGGKRASKSVCVSAEFVARTTGRNIIAADETEIPNPWPKPDEDYPRIFWIIGWDTRHIGETIYRLLFERGQGGSFRTIKDLETGLWRSYNRADPEDRKRLKESKLAEPLIPERYLEGGADEAFVWENKKGREFKSVRLINGVTIHAYPSSARNPKQGDAVSGIWIDEDIQFGGHVKEWQDRLTDEEGWFMWSAYPHVKNEAMMEALDRAEMSALEPEPQITAFQLVMTENPYLSDKGKKEALGRMGSDEEVARRNRGDLLTDSINMYQFSRTVHQIQRPIKGYVVSYEYPDAHKYLQKIWLEMNGFPKDWTRYLSIDPSNTRTGVLSWVVPPQELDGIQLGNVAIAEWEIVARRFSAPMLAKAIRDKIGSNRYEAFIMDQNAGRQTHAGRDDDTFTVYASAFNKEKVYSRQTISSFLPGCNVTSTRYRAVRTLLLPQKDVWLPSLMICEETCPETSKEFGRYRKKTESRGDSIDSVLDIPAMPRLFDMMASTEYFAAFIELQFLMGTAYVEPSVYGPSGSATYLRAKAIKDRQQSEEEGVVNFGGGGYTRQRTSTVLSSLQ